MSFVFTSSCDGHENEVTFLLFSPAAGLSDGPSVLVALLTLLSEGFEIECVCTSGVFVGDGADQRSLDTNVVCCGIRWSD